MCLEVRYRVRERELYLLTIRIQMPKVIGVFFFNYWLFVGNGDVDVECRQNPNIR